MLDALIFPDEAGPGNRAAVRALSAARGIASIEALTERLQTLQRFGLSPP